ncbi:alginate O-acetyltransferase AlgX-related protein [Acidisphaera sp. L21]|uniref:alginate O-acetyltransferase AlgX-related protein n=1 Tax=Acidisphaera sp. L21 TaxID=1641851 RepID=UPI00131A625A|nr:hypothetical protein [Acidisphaera sp. L21]
MTADAPIVTFSGPSRLGRRAVLAGAAAGALPLGQAARAAMVNMCVIGSDGWLFPAFDEVRRSNLNLVRSTAQMVNEGVAALKAAKVEVVISYTPAKSRIYREFLPADFKWSPDAEKRYDTALAELRKPGTLVPDQATILEAARKKTTDLLFFKADTHWTAPGAELSAILVGDAIKEKLHLPPSAKPGMKLAAPTPVTQERNDLAALLPVADQAKYPYQTYMVRKPVEAAGGGGLLDDDTADVVVIGNSFMQPIYAFANVVSERLSRPVALLWKVHQFSPWYNMLNFVHSDGFKKAPPKLIIWNFAEVDMETPASNPGAWGQTAMSPTAFITDLKKALGV